MKTKPRPERPTATAATTPNLVSRLSAPTTLAYELGGIAYTTAVAPLIMWAFAVFSRH